MANGRLPKSAIGKRIILVFDDHSINDTSETICEITGIVESVTHKDVIVRWWCVFDPIDKTVKTGDNNNEVARILQSAITKWAIIKEPRVWRVK